MTDVTSIITSLQHGGDMKQEQLLEIANELQAAVAAAVQAEREACAAIASRPELLGCNISAIILAEREACASLAESMKDTHDSTNRSGWRKALAISSAIRARE